MAAKLIIELDEETMRVAEERARDKGVSVTEWVTDYVNHLKTLEDHAEPSESGTAKEPPTTYNGKPIPPKLVGFFGVLQGSKLSEEDYNEYRIREHS